MALHVFPAKFVFAHTNKKHKLVKEQLFNQIMQDSQRPEFLQETSGRKLITNYFDPQSHEIIQLSPVLIESIWEAVDVMLSQVQLNTRINRSVITKLWYNVFNKGYSQEVHQHCGSEFSGIYILNSEKPNVTTFFNNENHLLLNQTIQSDFAKEGDIIIFPSSLTHLVPTVEEDNRVTIAFNISYES